MENFFLKVKKKTPTTPEKYSTALLTTMDSVGDLFQRLIKSDPHLTCETLKSKLDEDYEMNVNPYAHFLEWAIITQKRRWKGIEKEKKEGRSNLRE